MTAVTIQGRAYSDDGTTARDMLNGGHRTHFLPLVQDVVTTAGEVVTNAAAAAGSAAAAAAVSGSWSGTSSTSLAVGAGSKSLTTQTGKQFAAGSFVTVARTADPNTLMHGVITSYTTGTGALVVNVGSVQGSGTYTDWTVYLSGMQGPAGASGNGSVTYSALTGAYTALTTDRGKVLDATSGTWTLAFQGVATLGAGWATIVRNSGSGTITLDPSGAELIDGAATMALLPGHTVWVLCDGSVLRSWHLGLNRTALRPILQNNTGWRALSAGEDLSAGLFDTLLVASLRTMAYAAGAYVVTPLVADVNVSSSADARTWTLRTMPASKVWVVGSNGTAFLAVADGDTATATSADGAVWSAATALPAALTSPWQPIMVGGLWIAAASGSTTYYTSADGVAWTSRTFPAAPSNIALVGTTGWIRTGTTQAYTSTNGTTWTSRTLPKNYTEIRADSGGILLGAIDYLSAVDQTTDGITWTSTSVRVPLNNVGRMWVTVGGVKLVASDESSSAGAYTLEGTTWRRRMMGSFPSGLAGGQAVSKWAVQFRGVLNDRCLGGDNGTSGYISMAEPSSSVVGLYSAV